jgi:undecaprenyl diphosphate synthase
VTVLQNTTLPKHIAIIMDGNGRWAKKRFLPRIAGHKAGVDAVRQAVKCCVENKIEVLTLFAFSSENWRRPEQEVDYLMGLFISALERESKKLHEQNIQLRIIGDRSRFDEKLQQQMFKAEQLTQNNTGLKLVIAANYGGQWDICESMRQLMIAIQNGQLSTQDISPELVQSKLATFDLPNADLLIRTSGEQRISNFMLWQLAYAELYFTNVFWPDFDAKEFEKALAFYANRERRFGLTSEQLRVESHA